MDLPEFPRDASVRAERNVQRQRSRVAGLSSELDARERAVSDQFVAAMDRADERRMNRQRIRELASSSTRSGKRGGGAR